MDATEPDSAQPILTHDECVARVLGATRGRILHTVRGLPSALPTRICLINGTLLFLGDELVVEAALRRDVVSIQIDDASAAPATWSVVVTGRAELALGHEVPISLQPALERGGTMLALPMTLLVGRRETDVGMSG